MALSFPVSAKNTILTALLGLADAGSGPGVLVLRASTTTIAEIVLNDPSGTVSGGTLTFTVSPIPEDNLANASGNVDNFQLRDSAANIVVSGTVTDNAGNGDLKMPNVSISINEKIQLNSWTITLP